MKILKLIYVLLLLVVACSIDDPVSETGDPMIIALNSKTLNVSDTLKISGKLFGSPSNLNFVSINDLKVFSTDCIKWHTNEVWLVIPDTAKSGKIIITVEGKQSNDTNITIGSLQDFDVLLIPNGSFLMGSSSGSINEQPIASVTLSRSFYFSATEISQRIYRIVTGSNPSTIIADELAVNNIGWLDAIKFCNKLSKLQNLDSVYQISGDNVIWNTKANGWRLPTEAEWEYSCRAGTTTDYNSNSLVDVAWYSDNSGNKMHPVGKKLANDFGLFDMHGNLWEWCYDYYEDFYYDTRPAIDPTGPKAGTRRVIRGGAFDKGPNYARSANRTIPENLNGNTGLRIARTKFN